MSKQLSIIRHAKSDWTADCSDYNRVINDRGLSDAEQVGQYLHDNNQRFDQVYCSTATRAKLTMGQLNVFLKHPKANIQYEESLYLASLTYLVPFIEQISNEHKRIALIGHNPGLTDLCNFLTGDQVGNLPTCAVYSIDFHVDDWRAVGLESGVKRKLITPRLLKDS